MEQRYYLNGDDWEIKDFLGEDWVWRNAEKRNTRDVRWWRRACVPGSITNDLWKTGEIPDPYFEKNSLLLEWIPQRTWLYRKCFLLPEHMKGRRITLHFEGIDYEGLFFLNDHYLGKHSSMYTPVSFDVTGLLETEGSNQLSVVLQKAPDEQPQVSRTEYVKTHKCRMTYWWDFCPRMIHVGIWDDVYLEAHGEAVLEDVYVRAFPVFSHLKEASGRKDVPRQAEKARIQVQTTICSDRKRNGDLVLKLSEKAAAPDVSPRPDDWIGPEDENVLEKRLEIPLAEGTNKILVSLELKNPRLWYPNGYGEQPLYELRAEIHLPVETSGTNAPNQISHEKSVTFGIRSLEFVPNEGAEASADHYRLKVNHRDVYIKGWNWVPMDVMYGVRRPEKLAHLLSLVRDAHVNMLRVWGGGLIEREDFYELCDRYGILLWQEFIQSSSGIDNKPSESPEFLKLMEQEAQAIIPRKRNHPSLAVWCGGNELQSEGQSMIRESEPVIRLLRRAVLELDPDRKFLSSSPSGRIFNNTLEEIAKDPDGLHDVHGPWEHQGLTAQYTLYNSGTSLFSSEYGVEGMTNYNTLKKSVSPEHMWPPDRNNPVYFHRGSWWNNYTLVQECFGGCLDKIEDVICASQFLQYEGLKYAVESNRRRAFCNSGSMMWQFNEPYPNNYCTSSVDYYGQPKPVYYGIRKAYAPLQLTASFPSQTVFGLEQVESALYSHNSRKEAVELQVFFRIIGAGGGIYQEEAFQVTALAESQPIGKVIIDTGRIREDYFVAVLEGRGADGTILCENRYLFTAGENLACLLVPAQPLELDYKRMHRDEQGYETGILRIKNPGKRIVPGVKLQWDCEPDSGVYGDFSDNFPYLLPGEEISVTTAFSDPEEKTAGITAEGLGLMKQSVPLSFTQ